MQPSPALAVFSPAPLALSISVGQWTAHCLISASRLLLLLSSLKTNEKKANSNKQLEVRFSYYPTQSSPRYSER